MLLHSLQGWIGDDGKDHRCFEILLAGFFINGMGKYIESDLKKKVDFITQMLYLIFQNNLGLIVSIRKKFKMDHSLRVSLSFNLIQGTP